jgi:hypothetical protein
MKNIALSALIAILCMAVRPARADYRITWEGNSNLFQGTFEVTDTEMQSPNRFYSLSLTDSISFGSPDGHTFTWASGDGFGIGGSPLTNSFIVQLFQTIPGGTLEVEAFAYNDTVEELFIPPVGTATTLYSETGLWNISYIPEPSAVALVVVGGAACLVQRKRHLR